MKQKIRLRTQRKFTEAFKKSRVQEYETGQYTVKEISDLYQIAKQMVYQWIRKYSIYNKGGYKIVEMSESSKEKVKLLQERLKELERIVGQKQLHVDYLEKMIELAKEEYGIDIKKNSGLVQSIGSGRTDKK